MLRQGRWQGNSDQSVPLAVLPLCLRRKDVVHLKPPTYKVMLHNDNYNRREYVVKVLLKTVEGISMNDAVTVMQVCGPITAQPTDRPSGASSKPAAYLAD